MSKINIENIKSFIQGNIRAFIRRVGDLPEHIMEQYYYRLYLCKDTCLTSGRCKKCNCPTTLKAFASKSCNPGVIQDLMPKQDWEDFKIKNNINKDVLNDIKELVNERIKS